MPPGSFSFQKHLPHKKVILPWPLGQLTREVVDSSVGVKACPLISIVKTVFEELSCWTESSSSDNPMMNLIATSLALKLTTELITKS